MTGQDFYAGRRALVTGGLGFLGSNLVVRLAGLGAQVTVVDACVPGCGASDANLEGTSSQVRVIRSNVAETAEFERELSRADVIFNLAGEISHSRSMEDPLRDLELNTVAQLKFLSAVCALRRGVRIVYAGTRQVYGPATELPVGEEVPINPTDFNGVHKRAAELYHQMLTRMGKLDAVVLRLTNVYGPRLGLHAHGQGFLSVFLRKLLAGEDIDIFGDGRQLRDPVYSDDVVEAFLLAGMAPQLPHRVFNVGGPETISVAEIAAVMRDEIAPECSVRLRPFPPDHLAFDIGSYSSDTRRIRRDLGWQPRTGFRDGIRETVRWFAGVPARR